MQRYLKVTSLLLFLGLILFSCDTVNSPNSDLKTGSDRANQSEVFSSQDPYILINENDIGAEVSVTRSFNADDNVTTFTYDVKNVSTANGNPILTNYSLELPECLNDDFLAYTPVQGAVFENDVIKWDTEINPNPSHPNNTRTYSISFKGNISSGDINASIQQKNGRRPLYTGIVAGPACPPIEVSFTFSGSVYIDANEDNIKQSEEYGLNNILVSIYSLNGEEMAFLDSVTTEEDGEFKLTVTSAGNDFRITVPDFKVDNEYYKARPVTFLDFKNVTDDEEDIHFAFVLDTAEMTKDLLDGVVLTNTRSSKYWTFQMQHMDVNQADVTSNENVDFTREEMEDLLELVELLLPNVPEPFRFDESDKIADALSILKGQKYQGKEISDFMRELLTAELNFVYSLGALTIEDGNIELNHPFNRAILIFGEAIACNALGTCPTNTVGKSMATVSGTFAPGVLSNATLSDGTRTLSAFNGTGGIGSR